MGCSSGLFVPALDSLCSLDSAPYKHNFLMLRTLPPLLDHGTNTSWPPLLLAVEMNRMALLHARMPPKPRSAMVKPVRSVNSLISGAPAQQQQQGGSMVGACMLSNKCGRVVGSGMGGLEVHRMLASCWSI